MAKIIVSLIFKLDLRNITLMILKDKLKMSSTNNKLNNTVINSNLYNLLKVLIVNEILIFINIICYTLKIKFNYFKSITYYTL